MGTLDAEAKGTGGSKGIRTCGVHSKEDYVKRVPKFEQRSLARLSRSPAPR